jgi:hypothetical protein
MKYRLINPEVFATTVTEENKTPTAKVGDFLITFSDGHIETWPKEKFLKQYRPVISSDKQREMYRLCTDIIEQENLVDDDNAETLLAHACDTARELRKLL